MKKKIIIAGAILIVLVGGVVGTLVHSALKNKATHTSNSNEYYYNEESNINRDEVTVSLDPMAVLPSRDEVNTTPDSIYCLVNKEYSLPADYKPDDLVIPNVSFNIDYDSEKKYLRQEASDALESLFEAAKKEGLELFAVSGYRSYARQQEIYETNLKTRGTTHTNQYSAKPGYSEHQTGLVMDISCESEHYDLQESFGETPEGIWVSENCAKYGFIIRYPEDKCEITGYAYEPWHLRYVGVTMATFLTENTLTLDEYYYYEPSYDFITDESEYINDAEDYSSSSSALTYSPTPSALPNTMTNQINNSNDTNNSNSTPSNSTVTSTKPATPSQAPAVSTAPVTEVPETNTEEPEESTPDITVSAVPSPSVSASTEPSVQPSQSAPSAAPSVNPTPSASQPVPSEDSSSDEGMAENINEQSPIN